jgi:hypothetical protein
MFFLVQICQLMLPALFFGSGKFGTSGSLAPKSVIFSVIQSAWRISSRSDMQEFFMELGIASAAHAE